MAAVLGGLKKYAEQQVATAAQQYLETNDNSITHSSFHTNEGKGTTMRLQDKVAVITGGNSGIGLGVADEFSKQGANVVIFGRSQESLDNAVNHIGNGTLAVQGDVTSLDDLGRLFQSTSEQFGKIDVLVVNAGVVQPSPVDQTDEANFDFHSNINFKGAFFTVQQALPYLKDGASVILNSSVANAVGMPGMAVYAATKAAVRSLARTMTAELAHRGIRVNTLSPGPIETPIWGRTGMPEQDLQDMSSTIQSQVPLGRFGSVSEMAKAALFLASDDSSFVAGAELAADGGMTQV